MPHPDLAVVTGAFSYTGRYVAWRLLDQGVRVRTLARSPDRGDSFGGLVEAAPLDFSDPDGLCRLMRGAGVLYNTIWVRYAHGRTTFDLAVENTRTLLEAAGAGVGRIVHFSVATASTESGLPYTKRLELPVRIAVPRLTEPPTTSRRRYHLLSTLAHLRVLELPAKDGGSKDHNPIDISNRVLPTVKLGPPHWTKSRTFTLKLLQM